MYTELEMYNHVKEAYGDVDFHPTAGCLWIQQAPDQRWEPPTEEVCA